MADILFAQRIDQAKNVQYATPTTGQTVTAAATDNYILINPAGTLVALTVVLPPTPYDKQEVTIATSQIITGFTLTSAKSVLSALTTMALGGFATYKYNSTADFWFRVG